MYIELIDFDRQEQEDYKVLGFMLFLLIPSFAIVSNFCLRCWAKLRHSWLTLDFYYLAVFGKPEFYVITTDMLPLSCTMKILATACSAQLSNSLRSFLLMTSVQLHDLEVAHGQN